MIAIVAPETNPNSVLVYHLCLVMVLISDAVAYGCLSLLEISSI